MKALWRTRPNILAAVTSFALQVRAWSIFDDRRTCGLAGYIANFLHHAVTMSIHEFPPELNLACYCDSDVAGFVDVSRSTSEYKLALEGLSSFAALSWSSRCQKTVPRSNTEATF